jgi:hypothetical protein
MPGSEPCLNRFDQIFKHRRFALAVRFALALDKGPKLTPAAIGHGDARDHGVFQGAVAAKFRVLVGYRHSQSPIIIRKWDNLKSPFGDLFVKVGNQFAIHV